MTYKIVKDGSKFVINELSTEQRLGVYDDHGAATKVYRFLKNGGAFDGFTPSFILTSLKNYVK